MNIHPKTTNHDLYNVYIPILIFGVVLLFFIYQIITTEQSHAQVSNPDNEIQSKISQRQAEIKALEEEIASYQKQINELSSQANSLSATIKSLDLTKKKLEADIKVTESKIIEKNLEIQKLGGQILDKEKTIVEDRRIISNSFVTINEYGDRSVPELLLASGSLSQAWNTLDELSILQKSLSDRIQELQNLKANLETNKKSTEKAKSELETLKKKLTDQQKVVIATTNEKNQILSETKQSEAQYQKILAERKSLKEAFEREVLEYESQLRLLTDSSSIPTVKAGILAWPLDSVYITQNFGNTPFATANPQVYNGKGHTGVDFRASIGTPIKASMSGVVSGVDDTDKITIGARIRVNYNKLNVRSSPDGKISGEQTYGKLGTVLAGPQRAGEYNWWNINFDNGPDGWVADISILSTCYSYGKWIMVRHPNGLSTLYAHLSVQSVSQGQSVTTGQVIGYSGNTGYSTGPHLHFGVYATEGVQIKTFDNSINCKGAVIPLADFKAYLNPLSYLPAK